MILINLFIEMLKQVKIQKLELIKKDILTIYNNFEYV
jgi:hypothetical protein